MDLSSLSIVDADPISICKFLAISSISSVREAKLGRILPWEGSLVLLIELLHELGTECLDSHSHGDKEHDHCVQHNKSQK